MSNNRQDNDLNRQTTALKAKPGRPSSFDREQAIEAAMQLFWKQGFLAVSATDLADAMRIRRSSFYHGFGSRETVFIEALQRYAAQAPDAPLREFPSGRPVIPALIAMLREVCRVRSLDKEARGCLVCNAVAELVGVDEALGPLLENAVIQRTAQFQRLLAQAVSQSELAPFTDEEAAAAGFTAFLIGLNTLSKVAREEQQLWAICRQFLKGLGVDDEHFADPV
ncbi:MAG: TetR/AcrR family transcriptional regulator [Methylomonas sp.]|nr:TetR/AcrR family transcriptional regulator [Methylomonas sp.]